MAQIAQNKKKFNVYDYDAKIQCTFQLIEKELPEETIQLIKNYANVMTAQSMAKATIHKHIQTILNLSRFVGKDWNDVTKPDIDALVAKIVQTYSDNGQETNTTHDHKKILKIFFRWFKLGSRSKDEVGDPPETKHVKIKRVKDKIRSRHADTPDPNLYDLYSSLLKQKRVTGIPAKVAILKYKPDLTVEQIDKLIGHARFGESYENIGIFAENAITIIKNIDESYLKSLNPYEYYCPNRKHGKHFASYQQWQHNKHHLIKDHQEFRKWLNETENNLGRKMKSWSFMFSSEV